MEIVEFLVHQDFEQSLLTRFKAFIDGISSPCVVELNIESNGGEAFILMEMVSLIEAKKVEGYVFKTKVETYAYSCGLYLFLIGDIREASETARFMYHSAGFDLNERVTSTDLRDMLDMLDICDAFTDQIIQENTSVDPGMLEILRKNDNFLSRQDLIFLGFMQSEYEPI